MPLQSLKVHFIVRSIKWEQKNLIWPQHGHNYDPSARNCETGKEIQIARGLPKKLSKNGKIDGAVVSDLMLFRKREIARLFCLNFMATLTSQFSLSFSFSSFLLSVWLFAGFNLFCWTNLFPFLQSSTYCMLSGKKSAKSCPISIPSGFFACLRPPPK